MYIEFSYGLYIIISVSMTIWVAKSLSKNGRVFLVDSFNRNDLLADSVNHLLVVGFYLLNFGYILLALKTGELITSLRDSIELLSVKIGFALLVLGMLHVLNIIVISRWNKRPNASKQ